RVKRDGASAGRGREISGGVVSIARGRNVVVCIRKVSEIETGFLRAADVCGLVGGIGTQLQQIAPWVVVISFGPAGAGIGSVGCIGLGCGKTVERIVCE